MMSELDRFFQKSGESELHPKARQWRRLLTGGAARRAECEIWRKRDGLLYTPPKIFVVFYGDGDEQVDRDESEWDPELNAELVRLKVKAVSEKNEAFRLSLMLRAWFAVSETRHGDGYFNSVLHEYLSRSPLAKLKPISDVLQYVKEYEPYKESVSYADCSREIDEIMVSAGHLLVDGLEYSRETAELILCAALAQYLDERFSVSGRKALGML